MVDFLFMYLTFPCAYIAEFPYSCGKSMVPECPRIAIRSKDPGVYQNYGLRDILSLWKPGLGMILGYI